MSKVCRSHRQPSPRGSCVLSWTGATLDTAPQPAISMLSSPQFSGRPLRKASLGRPKWSARVSESSEEPAPCFSTHSSVVQAVVFFPLLLLIYLFIYSFIIIYYYIIIIIGYYYYDGFCDRCEPSVLPIDVGHGTTDDFALSRLLADLSDPRTAPASALKSDLIRSEAQRHGCFEPTSGSSSLVLDSTWACHIWWRPSGGGTGW